MSIGSFSVKNGVLVNILMVSILVLGYLSLSRLPQEQFSEVPFFWVNIIVPYPGVAAEDIEQTVTIKIENEMKGLDKLKEINSSTSEGLSVVRVEFDDGISNEEFDRLFQETRTRFSNVELPDGTLNPVIDDFSAADFLPVIEVVLSGEVDYGDLNRAALDLQERLLAVNQVSSVTLVGSRDRQIRIDAAQEKLESLQISMNELVRAVSARNISIPAGTVTSGDREFLVRTYGEIEKLENFENIIVRRDEEGSLRVADIARVYDSYDPFGVRARYDGEQAIILRVAKVSRGDSIKVIEGVKAELTEFTRFMPVGIKADLFSDSTVQIRNSIDVLLSNALFGFLLLVIILFLFIGLRNALMTALGIPIAFALTFVILELTGETFNTNTLFGLVLVLGLIVDHAIVIIENSYRLQESGLDRHRAAVEGTNQVVWPVIAATGTTVAAFLPLMILPGTIGKFLRVIPFTVSVALVASTFEALIFLPSHFADWPGGRRKVSGLRDRFFQSLRRGFSNLLERLYRRRGLVVLAALLIMILSFALLPTVNQDLFSSEDFTLFYIDIEMPVGTGIDKTARFVSRYEELLLPLRGNGEVVALSSSIGFRADEGSNTAKSNLAQIIVDLTEIKEGRTRPITAIMAEVEQLTAGVAGAEEVVFRKATNGPPVSPPISFRLFGNDYDELATIAADFRERLSAYPELFNIGDNVDPGTPEIRVMVDENRAAELGLSVSSIGAYLRGALDGVTATTYFRNNEEVDVIVGYAANGRDRIKMIEEMKIPAVDGRQIPFSSVASLSESAPLASIKRVDGKREVTVEASAYSEENIRAINAEISDYFNRELADRYPDVELSVGGEFSDFDNLLIQILRIFLLGLFLIYLILGSQFNSYSQPFLILTSLPFAFAGVTLYLVLSGTPFSTTVLYATVALAGIAVNDAIVLISFINERRAEGVAVGAAVKEAAATRMRPILLTSVTTIAGLTPTALGLGGRSVVWGPMAATIIFGLIFSTLTALIVIPSLYGLLYDRRSKSVPAVRGDGE